MLYWRSAEIDADRKGDDPYEQQCAEGDQRRHAEPVPDEVGDRRPILERDAEVALERIADPAQILDRKRLVEAVAHPQRLQLLGAGGRAGGGEIGGVARDEVAGRQLDDGEGDHRNGEEGRDHPQEPPEQEIEHRPCCALAPHASPIGSRIAVERSQLSSIAPASK